MLVSKVLTLTEQVAQRLIEDIRRGVYPVGSKLPSGKDLASQFGVSPAVIREVTERLRSKGLVESRQGAGCTVKALTEASGFRVPNAISGDLSCVFELRMDLESAAAALAAARRSPEQLDALAGILKRLEDKLYDPSRGVELDVGFHVAIAEATNNRYYADLLQYLNTQLRQSVQTARANSAMHQSMPEQVHREHLQVFEAIRASDPERARAAMMRHLQCASARLGLSLPGRHFSESPDDPPD
jgi:GntR family transcriptional repressor for pyruvate dehydrogenase complex